MIEIVVVEAVGSIGSWWVDVHIAKVIVHNVDGIVGRWAQRTLINSVIDPAGFQFGEYFCEEAGLSVDAQHAWAEAVQKKQATDKRWNEMSNLNVKFNKLEKLTDPRTYPLTLQPKKVLKGS